MDRKDFLKMLGIAGASSLVPAGITLAKSQKTTGSGNCVLIPSETAGPFPWDLTANNAFFRQDIRETQTGVQLNLKLKIIGDNNCLPMPDVRVNIWHCTKDGLYSAYDNSMNPGQAGLTYLRGWQIADANGEVEFITILPGWYNGRICHIHFQVYVSSVYAAISQLTFDVATKNAIYAANPTLYTKGADPMSLASDNIFNNGYTYQMATLTPNTSTGGYDSYLEVTIQGTGVTGLIEAEPETGGQFKIGQNYPNPYVDQTTIPLTMIQAGKVKIELFDLTGRKVASVIDQTLDVGTHEIKIDMSDLGLSRGNYAYQVEVQNSNGTFRQSKMLTAQ